MEESEEDVSVEDDTALNCQNCGEKFTPGHQCGDSPAPPYHLLWRWCSCCGAATSPPSLPLLLPQGQRQGPCALFPAVPLWWLALHVLVLLHWCSVGAQDASFSCWVWSPWIQGQNCEWWRPPKGKGLGRGKNWQGKALHQSILYGGLSGRQRPRLRAIINCEFCWIPFPTGLMVLMYFLIHISVIDAMRNKRYYITQIQNQSTFEEQKKYDNTDI